MGSYNFGNNPQDGYQAKSYAYDPKWEKGVDYNPDHHPSFSLLVMQTRGKKVIGYLQVKGLGVMVVEAGFDPETGRAMPQSLGQFTISEIGYSPKL